jgi:hypothetical protein
MICSFGFQAFCVDKWLKLSRFQGMAIWFLRCDKGGAQLAKYTITIFHEFVIPVTKTFLTYKLSSALLVSLPLRLLSKLPQGPFALYGDALLGFEATCIWTKPTAAHDRHRGKVHILSPSVASRESCIPLG